jgi:hypothetical protein
MHVSRSDETYLAARGAVVAAWGPHEFDLDMRIENEPPWLHVGDLVRLPEVDPDSGHPPYGQLVGFLIVGGAIVVQPGAGGGIFVPEDLQVVSASDVPPDVLADIRSRTTAP